MSTISMVRSLRTMQISMSYPEACQAVIDRWRHLGEEYQNDVEEGAARRSMGRCL